MGLSRVLYSRYGYQNQAWFGYEMQCRSLCSFLCLHRNSVSCPRHRLHECGNRKHRLCRIVLQRGGPHHLLLLSLGVRAWWKCRALNKMMEDHPQKRRPRAGAFVTNHQHELQLHAWFFHQFWRSSHLFSKITLPLKFRALKSSWAIFSWFPTFHVRMKLNRQESEGNDL